MHLIPCNLRGKSLFQFSNPDESPNNHKYISEEYFKQIPLFVGHRAHGLSALRATARSEGYFTVSPYQEPNDIAVKKAHEFIYGGRVVYADVEYNPAIHPVSLPGLALHPGSPKLLFPYRGSVNPHLGYGKIHAIKKCEEYKAIEKAWPGLMPKTSTLDAELRSSTLTDTRKKLFHLLCASIASDQLKQSLIEFTEKLAVFLHSCFPKGVHIKHTLGCYTVDSGTILTLDTLQPKALTLVLLQKLAQINSQDVNAIRKILLNQIDLRPLILFECIVAPDNIILTEQIDIQKTPMGYPIEVRVDALDFEGVSVRRRHPTTEVFFQYDGEVLSLIKKLKRQLPLEFQYLSGGMDLALTTEGKWMLLDVNPGGDSGFLMPGVLYNDFISTLIGRPTPLIKVLHHVSTQSPENQHQFLKELPKTILGHRDLNNMEEIALFLRDLQLKNAQSDFDIRCLQAIFKKDLYPLGIRSDEIIESTVLFNSSTARAFSL